MANIQVSGRTPVTMVSGYGPIQRAAEFAAMMLERGFRESRNRKWTRAMQTVSQSGGKTAEELSDEEKEAFKYVFGRDILGQEIVGGPVAMATRRAGEVAAQTAQASLIAMQDPEFMGQMGVAAALQSVGGKLVTSAGAKAKAKVEEAAALFDIGNYQALNRLLSSYPQEMQDVYRTNILTQTTPTKLFAEEVGARLTGEISKSAMSVLTEEGNEAAMLLEAVTGLNVGDLVGMTALGFNRLYEAMFTAQMQTDKDWEETVNNVIEAVSKEMQGAASPAQIRAVLELKSAGVQSKEEIPEKFRANLGPVWDLVEAGAATHFMTRQGEALKVSPLWQNVRTMVEIGRLEDPGSETFRQLANGSNTMMRMSMMQQLPHYSEMVRGMRSEDEEVRKTYGDMWQREWKRLGTMIPSFEKIRWIPFFRQGGTEAGFEDIFDAYDIPLDEQQAIQTELGELPGPEPIPVPYPGVELPQGRDIQ